MNNCASAQAPFECSSLGSRTRLYSPAKSAVVRWGFGYYSCQWSEFREPCSSYRRPRAAIRGRCLNFRRNSPRREHGPWNFAWSLPRRPRPRCLFLWPDPGATSPRWEQSGTRPRNLWSSKQSTISIIGLFPPLSLDLAHMFSKLASSARS